MCAVKGTLAAEQDSDKLFHTVPLRVSGAVISVVPVVGNTADKVINTTADIID
jgi:hypothetical protein